jgi:MFS family permease
LFWAGLFSSWACRMMSTLVAWWMYELTRDAFYIGMIGLSEAVPAVLLALYAGYVIDRSEKRRLLLTTVLGYGLCILVLLGTSTQWFTQQFGTKLLIVFIYSIIFITGIIRSFSGPSFSAIVSSLVPRDVLVTAAQLSSTSWLIASIMGHATAGFLIAGLHVTGTFVSDLSHYSDRLLVAV